MAGGGAAKSNPPKARKRVEADTTTVPSSLVRAKDGSAFTRCDECKKDVPVALISFHSCSLDAKIKMNLEAQVVEKPAEVKRAPADRKKTSEPKSKKAKIERKVKKGKDPNMPKRPPTAFFLFMDDFRKAYKEENPDSKGVKEVAKQGGEKWKSMTDEEKKPYLDKAAELKAEYEKAVESHNTDNAEDEGASDKEDDKEEDKEAAEKEVEDEVSDPE
ncbi:high mobility group B protein 7-like [Punica granatum]|uniref:High mobility group B protein 7-like n=2 Tax=Punica granatum TaxID=22663 RepID=A0A6P8BY74_PUNGR|nr:high mobility group B protein 7-like [Punica granatum]PKI63957.1 hypothetical protein CRG98_015633 [Punica granatum]